MDQAKDKPKFIEKIQRAKALKGLTFRQKTFVKLIGDQSIPTIGGKMIKAGYTPTSSKAHTNNIMNNPRIVKAIQLYYQLGEDEYLADLARGHIGDTLLNKKAPPGSKDRMAELALKTAGKIKNFNVNRNINLNVDMTYEKLREEVLNLLSKK